MQTTSILAEPTATFTDADHLMMQRALALAAEGIGRVSPGPLVGCVIVDTRGEIVGEGFYVFEDISHAETHALARAGEKARGGTAYVSLEPHAHHGRTPPCTDALIAAGIQRVVAPIEDLNPKVSGKGFEHLRASGVDVQTGLLANEAERLNEKYLHYMRTGLPFVHLKLAVSLDGKIATRSGDSRWVTGAESRNGAHQLRHESDAILIGVGTAETDDPELTDRSELPRRRPLVRVVLDERLQLSVDSKLAKTARAFPVIVFSDKEVDESKIKKLTSQGVEVLNIGSRDISRVLQELAHRSLQGVLVEGGSAIAGNFIDAGMINKVTFFIAPKIVGGSNAPTAVGGRGIEKMSDALSLNEVEVVRRGSDIEITGYPSRQTE